MNDNSDVQVVHEGQVVDKRMELLLSVIVEEDWASPDFDTLFTEVVQEFINEDCPGLLPSVAGRSPQNCVALQYLDMLGIDYSVFHKDGHEWPIGGYSYLPDATCAVRLWYDNGFSQTATFPGRNSNHAALGSMIQLCRELSQREYNQGTLSLH